MRYFTDVSEVMTELYDLGLEADEIEILSLETPVFADLLRTYQVV